MDPFIAEIRMFAGNFAPRGWALCDGQILAIAQNQALFALIGTTYGGDGRTTFALPDLRGRVAMHAGIGLGLTPGSLGEKSGSEQVTLNTREAKLGDEETSNGNPSYVLTDNQSITNLQPSLCVNFIIALEGMFPARS